MSAAVDAVCGAEHGTVSDERVNRRNGCRTHEWDTRAGTIEPATPAEIEAIARDVPDTAAG